MILGIIQARMTSSRLPGKVMKKFINQQPLIGLMIERIKLCKSINEIVVAITDLPDDDILFDFLIKNKINVYRGSENDVLERFYYAAMKYKPTTIVRLTGDCPLIDIEVLEKLIKLYNEKKPDYAWVSETFAEGLDAEIFSMSLLELIYNNASLASEHEHITQYIHNHSHIFTRLPLINFSDDSSYRITVDNSEDFDVVSKIFEHFYNKKPNQYFSFSEVKEFLDSNLDIKKINSHILRNEGLIKSLANDKRLK